MTYFLRNPQKRLKEAQLALNNLNYLGWIIFLNPWRLSIVIEDCPLEERTAVILNQLFNSGRPPENFGNTLVSLAYCLHDTSTCIVLDFLSSSGRSARRLPHYIYIAGCICPHPISSKKADRGSFENLG